MYGYSANTSKNCSEGNSEISSPLPVMSLSSPGTSLGVSMSSPELAQRKCVTEENVVQQKNIRLTDDCSTYTDASTETEIAGLQKEIIAVMECCCKSQCEQLKEEYAHGSQERKEKMSRQLKVMGNKYEDGLSKLLAEKDVYISSQTQDYRDKTQGLEKELAERKLEIKNLEKRLNTEIDCSKLHETEIASLSNTISEIEADKKGKIEMLIAHYETQLNKLKNEIICENKEKERKLIEDYQCQLTKLRADLEEQHKNYHQMLSDMEEKLMGETSSLRKQLTQMRCHYEMLIKSKEKHTEKREHDCKGKEEAILKDRLLFEQVLGQEKEPITVQLRKLTDIMKQVAEYSDDKILEAYIIQVNLTKKFNEGAEEICFLKQQLKGSSVKIASCEIEVDACRKKISYLEKELGTAIEEKNHEKEKQEKLLRKLESTQNMNEMFNEELDMVTEELSRQQQQLAVVEEEKRLMEVNMSELRNNYDYTVRELRLHSNNCRRAAYMERKELENQLQFTQNCYMKFAKEQGAEMTARLDIDIKTLRKDNTALETDNVILIQVLEKLRVSEKEYQRLRKKNEKYKIRYHKKNETISKLNEELVTSKQQLEITKRNEENLIKEIDELKRKFETEITKNENLESVSNTVKCKDDPMEFEWGRLDDLAQDHSMCPSLPSTHPVETQKCVPSKSGKDVSTMSTTGNKTDEEAQLTGSGKKRKHVREIDSGSDSADNKSKHPKTGRIYRKPGLHTPGNSQNKSMGSKSANSRRTPGKASKLPRTPLTLCGTRASGHSARSATTSRNCEKHNSEENINCPTENVSSKTADLTFVNCLHND